MVHLLRKLRFPHPEIDTPAECVRGVTPFPPVSTLPNEVRVFKGIPPGAVYRGIPDFAPGFDFRFPPQNRFACKALLDSVPPF